MHKANPPRKTGRPRAFDRGAALGSAMLVFWKHGYEATSITDLTAAMGITPPSLYTAFGDKERLFLEAIERYALGPGSAGPRALAEEPTARGAVQRWLHESAEEHRRGPRQFRQRRGGGVDDAAADHGRAAGETGG